MIYQIKETKNLKKILDLNPIKQILDFFLTKQAQCISLMIKDSIYEGIILNIRF
jgi:hypothetical protein